eukprot:301422-Pleurochrysis_carterae.AAC.1
MSCSTRARRHSISATAEPNDADMAPIWLSSSRCAASYCRPLYKASARLSTRSSACTPLSCSCGADAASGAADADAPSGSDSASRTSPETPACVDSPHVCTPPPPSLTHDQADSETAAAALLGRLGAVLFSRLVASSLRRQGFARERPGQLWLRLWR